MKNLLLPLFLLCFSLSLHAEEADLARLFERAGVSGTVVIESLVPGRRYVHDAGRAARPFTAASTFKVLNTLIALEEGVIGGAEAVIPWDGARHGIAAWNRDQTLESAFRVSCVWCYQELARRVGAGRYPAYLRTAGFGRLREPFDGTQFWLDGSLTVSADQQVAFLRRVATRSLPFRAEGYEVLRRIMLVEETPAYRLYAKTGWASRGEPGIGWYVGYVEREGESWLFALNIDTRSAADLPLRERIAREALRAEGILPALPAEAD